MSKDLKTILICAVVSLFVIVGVVSFKGEKPLGQATSGLSAVMASSSPIAVGALAVTLFPASACTARIVSTVGGAIMLSFGEASTTFNGGADSGYGVASTTLSGIVGHVQAASSTVVYDSGIYGCGLVSAISGTNGVEIVTVAELQ